MSRTLGTVLFSCIDEDLRAGQTTCTKILVLQEHCEYFPLLQVVSSVLLAIELMYCSAKPWTSWNKLNSVN